MAANGIDELICSSFPPLDPNGQPFSMILRGDAAELASLRSALSAYPHPRHQLQLELQHKLKDIDDNFGDVVMESQFEDGDAETSNGGNQTMKQQVECKKMVGGKSESTINDDVDGGNSKKRSRDDAEPDEDGEQNDEEESPENDEEQLLLYLPKVKCTCSSWKMNNVGGELFVTSLRVLFVALSKEETEQYCDVAIDARCIALHAVDSLPPVSSASNGETGTALTHVYCQLSEPSADEGTMACPSAMSMAGHAEIVDEDKNSNDDDGEENNQDEEESFEDHGAIEVYFRPVNSEGDEEVDSESQSNNCQILFDSLTNLASLNPAEDSDEGGGGLFNLMSLMAGMGDQNGFGGGMGGFVFAGDNDDDNDDDEMVVRFGGSNNIVENDDENEGATNDARQAMLNRLDGMLTVPPEYEIASSEEDGQFLDAEDDDELL